ncbi:hypothetical protein JCM11641_002406 [Rhodosporidiobolus odoratus]
MDNPWGDDSFASSPPQLASPKLSLSPPTSSTFTTPAWGTDDEGWGSAADDYTPGAFGGTRGAAIDDNEDEDKNIEVDEPTAPGTDDRGWNAESPELRRPPTIADETSQGSITSSPALPPVSFAVPPSPPTHTFSAPPDNSSQPASPTEEPDDGRGWAGAAEDDLPPIASLRIALPSPPQPAEEQSSGWVDPAETGWEPPDIPDTMPSFGDAFERAKTSRRESMDVREGAADQGEEAWGSAKGWEERREAELQREREMLEAEEKAKEIPTPQDATEQEEQADEAPRSSTDAAPAARSAFSRFASVLPKFKAGVDQTAAKSAETINAAFDSASGISLPGAKQAPSGTGMSSIEGVQPTPAGQIKGHAGDEFDLDAPSKVAPVRTSWWSRGKETAAPAAPEQPKQEQEEDPRTLGVEEVNPGESGRTDSAEPQQQGAVGRFLSRFKKPTAGNGEGEQRRSTEKERASGDEMTFKDDDFDVLASVGVTQMVKAKEAIEEVEEEVGGFFGDRLRRGKAQQLASAPPEDDFGGLLGSLATAPVKPSTKPASARTLDPFDPLGDTFGFTPAPQPVSYGRSADSGPVQPISISSAASAPSAALASFRQRGEPQSASSAAAQDDSFDAFFDSVVASTSNPQAVAPSARPLSSSTVLSPIPRGQPSSANILPPKPPASLRSLASRSSLVSPPPRIATISPPARTSTASPSSASARPITPILPLAPPPPPSQPLASSRGGSGGRISIAPPPPAPSSSAPPAVQRAVSPIPVGTLAPAPVGSTPEPAPPPQRSRSGPLSLDDLSFFES